MYEEEIGWQCFGLHDGFGEGKGRVSTRHVITVTT